MSEVKVCLSTVIGNKYLTMLNRIHRSRINIDIGIKFLHCNGIASCFEKTPERCSGNSLSKTGDYSACNKYIFHCHSVFPPP